MKVVSTVGALAVKEDASEQPAIRVCMHVLREARGDVRAMHAASALLEAGYKVSIVDVECQRARDVEENIDGVCLKHLIIPSWHASRRFQPWFFLVAMQTFILSIRRLIQIPADIYHASDLTALPASFIVAKLRRKPLIFEAYELPFPFPETDVAFWRFLGRLLILLLVRILPHCEGVIAVSPPIVEEMRNRCHLPVVTLIRNVPVYREVQKSDRLRQYLGLGSQVSIALYQGVLFRERGLDKLVHAATFLDRDIIIVMMGDGSEEMLARLELLIASHGVADRVKIIPPVPYEELLDWTASADLGLIIYPLDYSLNVRMCLPNKLFEYLMAGLPVLASPLDATAEIIRTYDVGRVVTSLEPQDIGDIINSMLADHAALDRMHRNALKAAQDCSWEKESQELLKLYHRILSK